MRDDSTNWGGGQVRPDADPTGSSKRPSLNLLNNLGAWVAQSI